MICLVTMWSFSHYSFHRSSGCFVCFWLKVERSVGWWYNEHHGWLVAKKFWLILQHKISALTWAGDNWKNWEIMWSTVKNPWATPHFLMFCFQGSRFSCNYERWPWAVFLQAFWRSFTVFFFLKYLDIGFSCLSTCNGQLSKEQILGSSNLFPVILVTKHLTGNSLII